MFKVICVTQMSAAEDFFSQLEKICAAGIDRVILREKTLSESEYEAIAERTAEICGRYGVPLSLHTFVNAAKKAWLHGYSPVLFGFFSRAFGGI